VSTARRPATHHHLLPNTTSSLVATRRNITNTTIQQIASALIAKQAAVDAVALAAAIVDVDQFWLVFGAALVFLMQGGFALLEVGAVREKNTKNILMKVMPSTLPPPIY
jgi:hypothetical protein